MTLELNGKTIETAATIWVGDVLAISGSSGGITHTGDGTPLLVLGTLNISGGTFTATANSYAHPVNIVEEGVVTITGTPTFKGHASGYEFVIGQSGKLDVQNTTPTGDDSNIMLWSVLMCASTLALAVLLFDRKRRFAT